MTMRAALWRSAARIIPSITVSAVSTTKRNQETVVGGELESRCSHGKQDVDVRTLRKLGCDEQGLPVDRDSFDFGRTDQTWFAELSHDVIESIASCSVEHWYQD